MLALNVKLNDINITLITLYGPNKDEPLFFNHITDAIEKFSNNNIIVCGDFNITLDQTNVTFNYKHVNNPNSREAILKIIETYDLVDSYRNQNPISRRYTWRNKSSKSHQLKQSRIDYFLVSTQLNNLLNKTPIDASYRSDHSPITIEIRL